MSGRLKAWGLIGGVFVTALACAVAAAEPAPARVEVPIAQTVLSDGDICYSVPVTVAGAEVQAMLDTGSTGLRLLAAAAPPALAREHGRRTDYGYGSGVDLSGEVVRAGLAIGVATSKEPVSVEVVRSVACEPGRPDCPASRVNAADYRIGGDGLAGQGFAAILGVNLREADTANPLEAVGARAWIVVLPKPGEAAPGALILNPSPDELQGFTLFRLNPAWADIPGGFHDAAPGCLVNLDGRKQVCGPVLLDSGAPGVRIVADHPLGVGPWTPGTAAALNFGDTSSPVLTARFSPRDSFASQVGFTPAHGPARIAAGSLPYYAFSVLYDPIHGVIGLKPR